MQAKCSLFWMVWKNCVVSLSVTADNQRLMQNLPHAEIYPAFAGSVYRECVPAFHRNSQVLSEDPTGRFFRRSSSGNLLNIPAAFWVAHCRELCASRGADAIADGENHGQAIVSVFD